MAIQGGRIQKANKKLLNAKGKGKGKGNGKDKSYIPKPTNLKPSSKEHPAKDDACHHCKEVGHCKRNCPAYLAELIKKKKQVGTASSSSIFIIELFSFPNKSWVYDTGCAKHNLDSTFLWHCCLAHISKKRIEKLQHGGLLKSTDEESFDKCVSCLSGKMTRKPFPHRTERATDLLGIIHTDVWGCEALVKRDTLDKLQQRYVKCNFIEFSKWVNAMNVEMQSMKDNQVRRLVNISHNCKTVGSKWLFKKKTDMDGIVHTYKARLVAKGYTQTYGVDYEETFSPVADIRAIRILIAIAAKVCKLQRSIYGLKQASRSWNKRFDEEIKRFGFAQNLDEPCVYQKASGSNVTFLILYVDDIIIMGNHIPSLQSVKSYLGKCFAMKDLGEAAFILGIKIYRDRSKRLIRLSQSAYMDKILKRFRMDNSKRGYIPMQERLDLNKTQGASTPEEVKRMQNVPYASVNPGKPHWTAVKTILKYLRNIKDMILVYDGNPEAELRVDCYCNAGFETNRDDINKVLLQCLLHKLNNIAALEAAMEAVWIRKFILGLGIVPTINEPIKMFCDNSAALLIANEPGVQRGARHYHRRYHYVRECIELGEINLLKVHTDDNLADPFTKALPKGKLTQHARSMGLRLASSFM
ncbi:retrotransposon protein, putative, ty1-copia subclass [Tanacetum coccineum]